MEKNKGCTAIDVIIIDEVIFDQFNSHFLFKILKDAPKKASQCLEVDFLIPMRFSCNKVIQVGDPEQVF